MVMELKTRQAKNDELDIALKLLYDAALWLKNRNIDYWQNWLNPAKEHIAWIADGFKNNEFHFACDEKNNMVGMYRLQYEDELFWGKKTDTAVYIHSFTTQRNMAGKGIGKTILSNIETESKSSGIAFLRLDCSPEVTALCKYYESYGFVQVGEVVVYGETLRLYEKAI